MADASRFPHLAPPFAIVGASAGWLSARLIGNPLLGLAPRAPAGVVAVCAMVFAALTGAVLTRLCVRRLYVYEIDTAELGLRPWGDRGSIHVGAVLLAGTASGALSGMILGAEYGGPIMGAAVAFCCTLAFVPICLAVVAAARRAQRARLGSLVAGSDRRAVWGILATTLAVAATAGALDGPAAAAGDVPGPTAAIAMVIGAGLVTAWVFAADLLALRRARRALAPGLAERGSESIDAGAPMLDLGLGEGLLARLTRSASAYRGRDRAVALVQGSPGQALDALGRASRRGLVGVGVVLAVAAAHAVASTAFTERIYEEHQCREGFTTHCARAAEPLEAGAPTYAAALYRRGCGSYDAPACAGLGRIYVARGYVSWGAAQVVKAQTTACAEGHADGCALAAELFDRRNEKERTFALLEQMCALRDLTSCNAFWEPRE